MPEIRAGGRPGTCSTRKPSVVRLRQALRRRADLTVRNGEAGILWLS